MKTIRIVGYAFIFFIFMSMGGCDSSTSGPPGFSDTGGNTPGGGGGPSCKQAAWVEDVSSLHTLAAEVRRDADGFQHRLSDQAENFGGIFIDEDGIKTVYLKDLASERRQKSAIISGIRSDQAFKTGYQETEIRFKEGQFTFRELAAWREVVTANLLAGHRFGHVTSVHIHEPINRIVIGVDRNYWSTEYKDSVLEYLGEILQIPPASVTFEKEYAELDGSDNDHDFGDLTGDTFERQRPIIGGLRIRYSSSNCSLGFLGLYDGEEVFVTNGHCTDNAHGPSNTLYFQGERDEPNDVVGTEIADGPQSLDMCVTPNSDCWPCRWSDSAIVSIAEDVERARGFIAKTDRKSTQWMVEGSREIDEEDPVFTIVGIEEDILTGMTLHKVGGNSGWTSGEVIRTCVDSRRSSHELILQCQYRARYATSGGGTSGSPVFKRVEIEDENIENPVVLIGIHRASSNRDQASGYSAFSPIDGVLKDFEGLEGLALETDTNDE
jgi:hypothetical protein